MLHLLIGSGRLSSESHSLLLRGGASYTFFEGPGQLTIGHLACSYIILGVLAAGANILLRSRLLPLLWLAFSLLYIPFSVRISDSLASSAPHGPVSEITTDKDVIRGRVVRVTSSYLLIAAQRAILTLPMSKVREVRRHYVRSP
jgi:hypothetical protein